MQVFPDQRAASPPPATAQGAGARPPAHAPCPDAALRQAIHQLRQTLDRLPE